MSRTGRLGTGELRLLRRLAIAPRSRKASLAQDLGVTRSAVTQLWDKLQKNYSLTIRGDFDYGKLGLTHLFGWAKAEEGSENIPKFASWLKSHSLTSVVVESAISSAMDRRVFFEARLPSDSRGQWFYDQLARFRKRPYSLDITYAVTSHISHHVNLGLFDGVQWDFDAGFRFGATIDMAKGYADVLPVNPPIEQSASSLLSPENLITSSEIDRNFYATASDLASGFTRMGFKPPSERTLRRMLAYLRKEAAYPYVEIKNIGLTKTAVVSLDEKASSSSVARLLLAQASTLPKTRVLHAPGLTALLLELPESVEWFTLSQVLSPLSGPSIEMCTFIADEAQIWNSLESLAQYLVTDKLTKT
jgi:hypothetical protein